LFSFLNISDPGVLAQESSSTAMNNFKQREKMLQKEMEVLRQKLEHEEEQIRQARDMSNTILQARIDIDKELGLLKKQYQEERKQWEKALSAEQEARRIEVVNAQRELDALQLEIDDLMKKSEIAALTAAQAEVLAGKLQDAEQMASTLKQSREALDAELTAMKQAREAIDAELTAMKQKYEADMKAWEKNMKSEQSAREKEASKSKEELESLKSELSKLKEERGDFGSLINLSFKALFGIEE
jgi:intracellular protein transport protein USO1